MRFKAKSREKNSFINMTVLYVMVGLVFILITAMNIGAYSIIGRLSNVVASLRELTKGFRTDFSAAGQSVGEVVQKGGMLEVFHAHVDKAKNQAQQLKKILPKLDLVADVDKFDKTAWEANSTRDPKIRKQKISLCERIVNAALARLDILVVERDELIKHKMSFFRFIYAVLLIGNFLAFGAIYVVIIFNDRAFKAKGKRLNMTNANFHAVIQGLDSILITVDRNGTILTWNSNAESYFGLSPAEAAGKNIYKKVPAFKEFKSFFDTAIYSLQRHYKYHEPMRVNKGPTRIVDILCVPMVFMVDKQEHTSLLIKIEDVTSFAMAETHGIRERCVQLVGTGMENVVKDASALNARTAETLQALTKMAGEHGLTEEMTPFLAYLNNSLAEISIVPQKYASTLQTGVTNKIQIDLNEMVMYVLRICLKTFSPSVNLEVSLNESKSWIMADPVALSRSLFCLLNNAAEAVTEMRGDNAEPGGIISVSIEKIAGEKIVCDKIMRFRHAANEPSYWMVLISDSGVGIAADRRPSIYDPFFTTKDRAIHKGLGLTVAVNVINELNGFIDVNSTPDHGSVFKIYIPELAGRANEPETTGSSLLESENSGTAYGQGTILFIDDDLFMRPITRTLLTKFGYSVIDTDNGFEALDIYANAISTGANRIQCVLINIGSGYFRDVDIVTHLKKMDPGAHAVVMITSELEPEAETLRRLGVADFIRKPYSLPVLSETMHKYASADGGETS